MNRLLLFAFTLLPSLFTMANTIVVKNIGELNAANKKAQPGDLIILQNGDWKDVSINLTCHGTSGQPITFKAETAGKVLITGHSQLRIGGQFIIVDGFYFTNGYAGEEAVITFRTDAKQVANNCRVTNTAIHDFNNPQRMKENYWIAFYGKNNRLDHGSFKDKKNMGVLLAVILEDERSRENFHSIDHNYFGRRPPLASNTGEIIRVGVSQHCEFNSNTQITDNFFEHCDGETEIVSIKSGSNVVRGNLFKECQGGVVLRHGNFNTVENNVFLGNGKAGTGGVRVINKGQWVVNNFFYRCRGVDFRSPLSVMNGIPNSPANRYVQVTDAVIANNTFYECTPVSFCEGSDAERTLPPDNVLLINNIFYNSTDPVIYNVYDAIKGFSFWGNEISLTTAQKVTRGFRKTAFTTQKNNTVVLPVSLTKGAVQLPDSLRRVSQQRLQHVLSTKPGFADLQLEKTLENNAYTACGAAWFKALNSDAVIKPVPVNCPTTEDVYRQLEKNEPAIIVLTGAAYSLNKPFTIRTQVQFTGNSKTPLNFRTDNMLAAFVIAGKGHLSLQNLDIDGENIQASHLVASDTMGSSQHYNLVVSNCRIRNLNRVKGCEDVFYAHRYMVADSIVFRNNSFSNLSSNVIMMAEEKDDKGYYNAEQVTVIGNNVSSLYGNLLTIYRGGTDESTMGPQLTFSANKMADCSSTDNRALIILTGVQVSNLLSNTFTRCNKDLPLVQYNDNVRARHRFIRNGLAGSGTLIKNKFVTEKETVRTAK